jgi:hypothetical protein
MHYKHRILVINKCDGPKWKRSHGRHRPIWEDNIKMHAVFEGFMGNICIKILLGNHLRRG